MACLMVTAVSTSQVELWRSAHDQKSNLERLIGLYIDGISAPALVRGDAPALSGAIVRSQADRSAGVEARAAILDLPNRILNPILEFISKLTTYEYIALEFFFCFVDFGTIALLVVFGKRAASRRLLKYLDRFPVEERNVINSLLLRPRYRTASSISLLAQWVAIGLLLFAIFNLFQTSSSRESQSPLAFSDFLNDVDNGRVPDVKITSVRR